MSPIWLRDVWFAPGFSISIVKVKELPFYFPAEKTSMVPL